MRNATIPAMAENIELMRFSIFGGLKDKCDAAVSARSGGVSADSYQSLNMGFLSGDEPFRVIENRRRACDVFLHDAGMPEAYRANEVDTTQRAGDPLLRWVGVRQVHGACVFIAAREHAGCGALAGTVGEPGGPAAEADAICTNEPGLILAIQVADCVPVAAYDSENHALGVAHCGWRGTAAKCAIRLLETMGGEYGTHAKDVYIGIGPGICGGCCIVGGEVASHFLGAEYEGYRVIWDAGPAPARESADSAESPPWEPKYHPNIWGALHAQLAGAGVPKHRIETMVRCSMEDETRLYSYRRDGEKCGRNALLAMLI